MKERRLNLTVILVTLLVILAVFGLFYMYNASKDRTTVEAQGVYTKNVQPDQVIVYLTIETKGDSAEKVKDANAITSLKVLTSLKEIVDEKAIETENYNIYPIYDWSDGKQDLIGYTASNNIGVKIKEFNKTGKIIDAAVNNGAFVNYINFELSQEETNKEKVDVLAKATEDARKKAEAIVAGLGKKVGDVVSVSSSDYNYRPYPLFANAGDNAMAKEVATNIQPKSLEVYASVSVVYEIK